MYKQGYSTFFYKDNRPIHNRYKPVHSAGFTQVDKNLKFVTKFYRRLSLHNPNYITYSEQVALFRHTYISLLAYRSLSRAWNHPSTCCTRIIPLQRTISISSQGFSAVPWHGIPTCPCTPARRQKPGAQPKIHRHQRSVGAPHLCLAKNAL